MPQRVEYLVQPRAAVPCWAVIRKGVKGGTRFIAAYDNPSTANAVMRTLNAYLQDEK